LTTHIIWDWNGTILNDVQHAVDVMNRLLQAEGLPSLAVPRYRDLFRFPVRSYYEDLGFSVNDEEFLTVANAFMDGFESGIRDCGLRPGVRSSLQRFQEMGLSQSILSAAKQDSLREQVRHHGIDGHFEEVLGLDNHYAAGKTEVGLGWVERGLHPVEKTIFVGDTCHDFEVARSMGVRCVLVADGHQARSRLSECGCPVIDSIEDLPAFLS